MCRKRNSTNYHLISNPTFENENTGYFTFPVSCIYKEKDFLFDWINPSTKEHVTKVLPFNYVINHMKDMTYFSKEKIRKTVKCTQYYRISYKDIINYG